MEWGSWILLTGAWLGIVYLFAQGNSWPRAVLYAVAFGVVPLSHVWHIIHGEGSLTDWAACAAYETFLDYGCISDIPGTQHWDWSDGWWELDGALINTWEFTVAIELLVLKLLAAAIVWGVFHPRSAYSGPQILALTLALDAILSFILFSLSDPGFFGWRWSHDTLTMFGLFFSLFWLMLAFVFLTDSDIGYRGGQVRRF